MVGHGGGAVKAWIDHDQLGAALFFCLDRPLEAHRVRLGGVAAHHQNEVGVLDVHPAVGHGATTKGGGQCRHGRAVTDTRLRIGGDNAQRAHEFLREDPGFVGRGRGRQHAGGQPAVDWHAVGVLVDEIRVAVGLHVLGDALDGFVPADALPLVAAGFAHFRVFQSARAVYKVQQAGALGAQRATADRVIRVAFDVDDFSFGVFGAVAQAVHQQATAHRAIGAGVAHFGGAAELVLANFRLCGAGRHADDGQAGGAHAGGGNLEKLPSAD